MNKSQPILDLAVQVTQREGAFLERVKKEKDICQFSVGQLPLIEE